ncbi:MAG: GntR family transcriptional regulator [Amaricoccus sp.]
MNGRIFAPDSFQDAGAGPLYLQLSRRIADEIARGSLAPGQSLPPEREMASLTGLSRVTVRKAVQSLVRSGQLIQRRGSGTFVAPRIERVEQALSMLTSFSEDMARRGKSVRSVWISRALHVPAPDEMMVLGLAAQDRVARLERVRLADEVPMAIERAALASSILPDPQSVEGSLYAVLARRGLRPTRAVQRISAANLGPLDAGLLEVPTGAAALRIERVSYLPSGRVIEFVRSIYRGDAYDFAAELQIPAELERDAT